MRGLGWTLVAIGTVMLLWSMFMTTSVHTDMNYIPGIGLQEAKDVYNLGLLQRQMMVLHAGLSFFIAGTIAVCIGELIQALIRGGAAKAEPLMYPDASQSEVQP